MTSQLSSRINIDEPRWNQNTYSGRAKHFFTVTNPLNLLCSTEDLEKSKEIVTRYRKGENIPNLNEDEVWKAKHVYDSAFHPDTGEKMIWFGRMSAQVPMNMAITGCMLTFYRTTPQTVFWQWFNQSFNAVVNYTNRSGDSPIPVSQLGTSYVLATAGALTTALTLNNLAKRAPPLMGRFVPFAAVAAANCVNIPMMRLKELREGIPLTDENGNKIGQSSIAARWAISQVIMSRILMAVPGMILPPFFMDHLEKKGFLTRYPWFGMPFQIVLCGVFLTFTTPLCCALFPQKSSISISSLEPEIQEVVRKLKDSKGKEVVGDVAYYNKGL